jgi:hypothetical protein
MKRHAVILVLLITGLGGWFAVHAQKPFREYAGNEYVDFPLPPDYQQPAEFIRARLKYRDAGFGRGRGRFGRGGGSWTTDYPRSDRHFLMGVRRLLRVDTRSVEQVVELDQTDDIYNWPFVYGVEVGHWELNSEEGKQLRDYIDKGGFLMVDDFHGSYEWQVFEEGIRQAFPQEEIRDLPNDHPIFHTVYDLEKRPQIPGIGAFFRGVTYEQDGYDPLWRGILDQKGRVVVGICGNMDMGDAWEHSDDPEYPENLASLAYRIGMNYIAYDLTH